MRNFILKVYIIFGLLHWSCEKVKQADQNLEKVILDTDMGSDCDDVGALALLHEYANQRNAEILGIIYSSGAVPYGVGIIDAINRYYDHSTIPIGANYDKTFGDPVDKMNAQTLVNDTLLFHNKYISNRDVTEQTILNRKLLVAQNNNSVTYITIGHTKGLYDLMISKPDSISNLSGAALVSKKIKRWVALGALKSSNKELEYYTKDWNFFSNGTAIYTEYLLKHFVKPIYFVDGGAKVMTGGSLEHTAKGNIIREAYEEWLWNFQKKTLKDQRPSWDLVTVYFAIKGSGEYFEILDKGYLDFDTDKGCKWIRSDSATNQKFVIQKEGTDIDFSNYLNKMISKKGLKSSE